MSTNVEVSIIEQLSIVRNGSFRVKNAKIGCFEDKRVLSEVFMKLKCRWLQTDLADLKNTKTIGILLRV